MSRRNLTNRGPNATQPARLPALESARFDDARLNRFANAVREILEVRLGARGDFYERAVTHRDLVPQIDAILDRLDQLELSSAAESPTTTTFDLSVLASLQAQLAALRAALTADENAFAAAIAELRGLIGSGGSASIAFTAPSEGLTIAPSSATLFETFVFALANDLAALEALTGTGVARRTGTSAWSLLSITQLLDLAGSAAQGDILYRDASDWALLPASTAGRVLCTNGTGANPLWANPVEHIIVACSDDVTALTAGTAKRTFRMPYAATLLAVYADLTTAQASGSIFTVDINEAGTSILSTKLTIDNTEDDSDTASAQPVISDTALAHRAKITIDIDQVGDGTAKGLRVTFVWRRV